MKVVAQTYMQHGGQSQGESQVKGVPFMVKTTCPCKPPVTSHSQPKLGSEGNVALTAFPSEFVSQVTTFATILT